jgi:energy-coupling factor transporter ATP-binding protein EcfA2
MTPGYQLGPTDRFLLVGQNGSGKSTVARALTAGYRSQVVIDAKHEESLSRSVTIYDAETFRQWFPQRARRIVFRPDPDDAGALDVGAVMLRVLRYGHTALVVHDAALYASAGWILPAYRRAQLIGRSIEVPVWSLVQRPTGVHNVLLSEATHVFLFRLALESDRTKIAGVVGPGALELPESEFGFGYYGPSTGGALVRCSPMEREAPNDPPDNRQPGTGDHHGDGRNLRDKMAHPNGQRPGPERPGGRHLGDRPGRTATTR